MSDENGTPFKARIEIGKVDGEELLISDHPYFNHLTVPWFIGLDDAFEIEGFFFDKFYRIDSMVRVKE